MVFHIFALSRMHRPPSSLSSVLMDILARWAQRGLASGLPVPPSLVEICQRIRASIYGPRTPNSPALLPLFKVVAQRAQPRPRIRSPRRRCRDYKRAQKPAVWIDSYHRVVKGNTGRTASPQGPLRPKSGPRAKISPAKDELQGQVQPLLSEATKQPPDDAKKLEQQRFEDAALKVYHKEGPLDKHELRRVTVAQVYRDRYAKACKALDAHCTSYYRQRALHLAGEAPGFNGWESAWSLADFDIGWLKQGMNISQEITKIENFGRKVEAGSKDMGLIAHEDQEWDFPYTEGGYTAGTEREMRDSAPKQSIAIWQAGVPETLEEMYDKRKAPEALEAEDDEFHPEHEIEPWESFSCRPVNPRSRSRIDKYHNNERPRWKWTKESRAWMYNQEII